MTVAQWVVLGIAVWVALDVAIAYWLHRLSIRRHRPIAEHQDSYWHWGTDFRRHNDANGGWFL